MVGLFFGKAIGIFLSSWLILRLRLSVLPEGVTLSQILGIAFLAGIGFTMSIFIGTLAFAQQPELLHQAKIGIVFGSLVSGITGYIWLYKSTGK
jgi:NhaA family Na+:H+ antiporter